MRITPGTTPGITPGIAPASLDASIRRSSLALQPRSSHSRAALASLGSSMSRLAGQLAAVSLRRVKRHPVAAWQLLHTIAAY